MRDVSQTGGRQTCWRIDVSCGENGDSELRFREDSGAALDVGRQGTWRPGQTVASASTAQEASSLCQTLC